MRDFLIKTIKFAGIHHQKLANYFVVISAFVAVLGVWATFLSLERSAGNVERQLKEQRRATSVLLVSDFLTEIGDGILENRRAHTDFKRLVATRTNLLIAQLDFSDLKSQVIRFLGTNEFGQLFDVSSGKSPEADATYQTIDLARADLAFGNLDGVRLSNPNLFCSNLRSLIANLAVLNGADIQDSDLRNAKLASVSMKNASVQWTNLQNATISGSLDGTRILFSDLRGIRFGSDENDRKKELQRLVKLLLPLTSLYGSVLDDDLREELNKAADASKMASSKSLFLDVDVAIGSKKSEFDPTRKLFVKQKHASMKNWYSIWSDRRLTNCEIEEKRL